MRSGGVVLPAVARRWAASRLFGCLGVPGGAFRASCARCAGRVGRPYGQAVGRRSNGPGAFRLAGAGQCAQLWHLVVPPAGRFDRRRPCGSSRRCRGASGCQAGRVQPWRGSCVLRAMCGPAGRRLGFWMAWDARPFPLGQFAGTLAGWCLGAGRPDHGDGRNFLEFFIVDWGRR